MDTSGLLSLFMFPTRTKIAFLFLSTLLIQNLVFSQTNYTISGKVIDAITKQPLNSATIQVKILSVNAITNIDGTFKIKTNERFDTIQISHIGYELLKIPFQNLKSKNQIFEMKQVTSNLGLVTIEVSKKPGKSFMEKVIENKTGNNPDRFPGYSYMRYTRNELDLNNLDYDKDRKNNLTGLMASAYSELDSDIKKEKELPIYFSEVISNNFHSTSGHVEKKNIIAKKSFGLKTDDLLRHLEKYYFIFNVYDDWIAVFDQTYVSPLSNKAFNYYNFYVGDTMVENGNTIRQIRFKPLRSHERAFIGNLWINENSFAVVSVNMSVTKTANLNFINNIQYSQDYKQVYDSAVGKMVYMPEKYSSEVKFEAGPSLLGIPIPDKKEGLHLIAKSTSVINQLGIHTLETEYLSSNSIKNEETDVYDKSDEYWAEHRLDSLSRHERNIYLMIDTLKSNSKFQNKIKLISFAATGYWDFGNQIGVGSYLSFIRFNPIEGSRFRMSFSTLPGISEHFNLYGYGAYGTKDHQFKGGIGLQYIWNHTLWSKTSIWTSSDYEFVIDQNEVQDKENLISAAVRKNIPYTPIYVNQLILKHEQFLSNNFTALAFIGYRELNPAFDFYYHPLNSNDKPNDSLFANILPVAEASVGIRYALKERSAIVNYNRIHLTSFTPIVSLNYTYGYEMGKAQFEYHKVNLTIEQKLQLPPKSILYYRVNAGKIFGTIPYILLNLPTGNGYYTSNKFAYNTMIPFEFAADLYIGLHTRYSMGGVLFDKVPLLNKLGWRERFSYNMYWGSMTKANQIYNKNSVFSLTGKTPFIEASVGIENIFHLISIEYYRRFTHLEDPYVQKDGLYLGLAFSF